MTMCFVVMAVTAALAQGKKAVPPPPKPADEGPSLEVTMKFIQDKLNDIGPVNFVMYLHDDINSSDGKGQNRIEVSNVVTNPTACRIDYHWRRKEEQNGKVIANEDSDVWFLLKVVQDIAVMPMEQVQKSLAAAAGHPSWSFRVDPAVYVLEVRRTDTKGTKGINAFAFFDEQLANRVAQAIVHAVELCGGGSTPEPF
jgi:hypothetical protein